MGNFILEAVREAGVKEAMECTISIFLDLGCKVVEIDDIPCDPMVIPHGEVLELVLCIGNGVMGTKGFLEFSYEVNPAVHSAWPLSQGSRI